MPIFVCIFGISYSQLFCANICVYSRGFDIPKCWIRFWSQFPSWGLATLRWPSTCGFLHLLIFSFAYLHISHFLICIFAHICTLGMHICLYDMFFYAKLPKTSFAQFHVILIPFLHLWGVFGLPEFLSSAPAFPSAAAENFCICVCHCLCLPFFFFICV